MLPGPLYSAQFQHGQVTATRDRYWLGPGGLPTEKWKVSTVFGSKRVALAVAAAGSPEGQEPGKRSRRDGGEPGRAGGLGFPTSGLRAPETQLRPGGDAGAKVGRLGRQDHKTKGCQSPSAWLQEK